MVAQNLRLIVGQLYLKCADDLFGNRILYRKNIAGIFVEVVCPDRAAVRNIYEADRNADPVLVLLNRSLKNCIDAKLFTGLDRILSRLIGISGNGACRPNGNFLEFAQPSDDGIGHPQTELFVAALVADRSERQDGDRLRLRVCGRTSSQSDRYTQTDKYENSNTRHH